MATQTRASGGGCEVWGDFCFCSVLSWVLLILDRCRWKEGEECSLESCWVTLPAACGLGSCLLSRSRWPQPSEPGFSGGDARGQPCILAPPHRYDGGGGPVQRWPSRQGHATRAQRGSATWGAPRERAAQKGGAGRGLRLSSPRVMLGYNVRAWDSLFPWPTGTWTQTHSETRIFLSLILGVIVLDSVLKGVLSPLVCCKSISSTSASALRSLSGARPLTVPCCLTSYPEDGGGVRREQASCLSVSPTSLFYWLCDLPQITQLLRAQFLQL